MRIKHAVGALSLCTVALAGATPPPRAVVDGCLAAKAKPGTRMIIVPTTESIEDDDYKLGFRADFYRFRNIEMGYAQRVRRPDNDDIEDDALLYAGTLYPLKNAIQPGSRGEPLPRIDVNLSDWLLFATGSTRYLCVSSNFGGLGRSGAHQNIRFAYLLSLGSRRRLYWFVGDASAPR
jgi:hypothetical protein